MCTMYEHFAEPWKHVLDFSDDAKVSLYNHESHGTELSPDNGFAQGKKMLNLQVTGWHEMLREGTLAKFELYEDPNYPHWWLDSVLANVYRGMTYQQLLKECQRASGGTK